MPAAAAVGGEVREMAKKKRREGAMGAKDRGHTAAPCRRPPPANPTNGIAAHS